MSLVNWPASPQTDTVNHYLSDHPGHCSVYPPCPGVCLCVCVSNRKKVAPFLISHYDLVVYFQFFSVLTVGWRKHFVREWVLSVVHCLLCFWLFLSSTSSNRRMSGSLGPEKTRLAPPRDGEGLQCQDAAYFRYLFQCPPAHRRLLNGSVGVFLFRPI